MGKIKSAVRVLRLDPVSKNIAALKVKRDMPSIRKALKALASEELGQENFILAGGHYTILAKMAQEVDKPGMKLRGWAQDTSGICLIIQYQNANRTGGLVDCAIPLDLIQREVVWVEQCRQRMPKEEEKPKTAIENQTEPSAADNDEAGAE